MLNRIVIALIALTGLTASAANRTYIFSLSNDTVVEGKELKAGNYSVAIKKGSAILTSDFQTIEVPAHAESTDVKFTATSPDYSQDKKLTDIRIGGTKTMIVFGEVVQSTPGIAALFSTFQDLDLL